MEALSVLNIVNIVEISQGILLGILIWTNKVKGSRASIYLGAYLVMLGLADINYILFEHEVRMASGTILQLPTNFVFFYPVMLYLYTTEISGYRAFKPGLKWFLPGILEFGGATVFLIASWQGVFFDENSDAYGVVEFFYLVIAIFYMLYFLIKIIRFIREVEQHAKHNFSDLRGKTLKWVRISCIIILAGFFVFPILSIFIDETETSSIEYLESAINIITILLIASLGYKQSVVLSLQDNGQEKVAYRVPAMEGQENEHDKTLFNKVRATIEQEKLYTRQELTLKELAAELDVHEKQLSFLINRYAEKNFYNLINGYRVKEAQQLLLDDDYAHLSFLGIAFEAGFNSKATFNAVFKKMTGLTPRQYRDDQKAA